MTFPLFALVVYLWVIHSMKLPIAAWAIAMGLVAVIISPRSPRLPTPLLWLFGFLAWSSITSTLGGMTDDSSAALVAYGKLWLILFLALNAASDRHTLRVLVIAWLAIYAAYPVRGTLYNAIFDIGPANRFAWNFIFANPNTVAIISILMLPLCLVLLMNRAKAWDRVAAGIGAFLLPVIIILTQSRGSILALGTFGVLLLMAQQRRLRALALGALALGLIASAAPSGLWNRLLGLKKATSAETLHEVDPVGSADQRFEIWRVATAIIKDHPVAGVGLGNYPAIHREYALDASFRPTARGPRDPHSIYLSILAETGVPGLALYLGFLASILLPVVRTIRRTTENRVSQAQLRVLLIGFVAFLQACIFSSEAHLPFLYLYLAVLYNATALVDVRSQMAHALPPRSRPALIGVR